MVNVMKARKIRSAVSGTTQLIQDKFAVAQAAVADLGTALGLYANGAPLAVAATPAGNGNGHAHASEPEAEDASAYIASHTKPTKRGRAKAQPAAVAVAASVAPPAANRVRGDYGAGIERPGFEVKHPKDKAAKAWSGNGRPPGWYVELIRAGWTLDLKKQRLVAPKAEAPKA